MIKKTKAMCSGCTENFYNGNNPYDVKECWNFKTAEVVQKKFVPLDMRPPWNMRPETTLSCYRKKGYVKVDKETTC